MTLIFLNNSLTVKMLNYPLPQVFSPSFAKQKPNTL